MDRTVHACSDFLDQTSSGCQIQQPEHDQFEADPCCHTAEGVPMATAVRADRKLHTPVVRGGTALDLYW
jgi:hypothetical protein